MDEINSMVLDGTESNHHTPGAGRPAYRYRVIVNGSDYWIDRTGFRLLVLLATAELRSPRELTAGDDLATKYLWRLRRLIFERAFGLRLPVVNVPGQGYRLELDRKHIAFNRAEIRRFPDMDIRGLLN